jgi:sporulation-control protein spo0M
MHKKKEFADHNVFDAKARGAGWLAVADLCQQLGFVYSGKESGLKEILMFIDRQAKEIEEWQREAFNRRTEIADLKLETYSKKALEDAEQALKGN